MSLQVAIVTQTSPASPGTLNFTSGSITETVQAAIFFFAHSTTDGSTTDHGALGIAMWANDGFSNSPGSESFSSHFYRVLNGVAATDARGWKEPSGLATTELDSSPAVDVDVTTCTAISGGLQLNFVTTTAQIKITAVIFAGVGRTWVSTPGVTTTVAHETTGGTGETFQPDVLIVAGSPPAGFSQFPDDFRAHLGFVVGSAHTGASIDIDRGTNPTDADGRLDSVEIPFMISNTGGTYAGATFTIDSTGYNAQVTTGSAVVTSTVLAMKFTDALYLAADNLAVSGSAGTQSFSVGFRPKVVLGMSTLMTSENSTIDGPTASTAGYFAFTSSAARAYTGSRLEGTGTTAKSLQGDYAVATLLHTGTVAQQATLSQFTSSGFDLTFSTATAGFLTAFAIGPFTVDTESVQISEGVVFDVEVNKLEAPTETVEISDGYASDVTTDPDLTGQSPLGVTVQAGAQRARTLQAGAELGRTV